MKKVTYKEIARVIGEILQESNGRLADIEFVVGISRGGLCPAMVVSTTLIRPLVVAYIDKQDNVYFDRAEWIAGKRVLLVDDIVRTGKTMDKIKTLLLEKGAFSTATLAVFYLAAAKCHAPDYGLMTSKGVAFPWDEPRYQL